MNPTDAMRKEYFNTHADQWLDRFYKDETTGTYTKFDKAFQRLFSMVQLNQGDHVLDVGCGCGVLVPYILPRIGPSGRLYELDYAIKMIEVNKKLHPDKRIDFLNIDLFDLTLPEATCNAVICFACFPHLNHKNEALGIMSRLLKKGGKLAIAHLNSSAEINACHRKSPAVRHDLLPDAQSMQKLLHQNKFRIKKFIDEELFYLILAEKNGLVD